MTEVEWVDEPPPKMLGRIKRRQAGWMEELRTQPGRWAILPIRHPNAYYRTVGIEITTRRDENGNRVVYGRYIGEPDD